MYPEFKMENQKNHIQVPSFRHILDVYFKQSEGSGILAHQIESFNQFMEVDIPEIINMSNPFKVNGSPEIALQGPRSVLASATGLSSTAAKALIRISTDPNSNNDTEIIANTAPNDTNSNILPTGTIKYEYEVSLEFEKISFRKPTIFENNGAIYPMMPNDARLRNLTYAAPLNVDVKVTTTFIDNTRGGIRESRVRIFPNVHLGKIPVMLKSKYCLLNDQRHIQPGKLGECAEDMGGYFIIQEYHRKNVGEFQQYF